MIWFNKKEKKEEINSPDKMSPIEAVTHLCASIQISDGQVDYEEKKSWLKTIKKLFPEFSEERADRFLHDAYNIFREKDSFEKKIYIQQILNRIKVLLNEDQLNLLGAGLSELIVSDGIIMTSEIEVAKTIESELNISIKVDEGK